MSESRIKNTIRNGIFGFSERVLILLFPFLIRTAVLHIFGVEYLGLNSLFTSIIQVLSVAELGFSSAIVCSMYKPIAEGDSDTICSLLAIYRKAYHIIGTIVLLAGIAVSPFLNELITGDYPEEININLLYFMYLLNTVISYFLFAYKGCLFVAHQRTDVTYKISIATHFLQYFLQLVIILIAKNYYLYFILTPVFTIINNCITEYLSHKYYPELICKGTLKNSQICVIKKQIGGLLIQKISAVSRNSFDSIFITSFLGLTAAAMYSNYYYVLSAVRAIMSFIIPSLQASVGDSVVKESKSKNYNDYLMIDFIYFWISCVLVVCLFNLYQPFMVIWMGEKLLLPNSCVALFCIYFFQNTYGDVISLYTHATGLWWKLKHLYILNAVVNVVLNYVLGKRYGVFGIVLATIIAGVLFGGISFGRVLFHEYFTDYRYTDFILIRIRYIAVLILTGIITKIITACIMLNNILGFTLKAAVCLLISNLMLFLVYRKSPQFSGSLKKVKQILRRS